LKEDGFPVRRMPGRTDIYVASSLDGSVRGFGSSAEEARARCLHLLEGAQNRRRVESRYRATKAQSTSALVQDALQSLLKKPLDLRGESETRMGRKLRAAGVLGGR
jgi:hypothetical protein